MVIGATIKDYLIVRMEGFRHVQRAVGHYNLNGGELSPEATIRNYRIVQTEDGRQVERRATCRR